MASSFDELQPEEVVDNGAEFGMHNKEEDDLTRFLDSHEIDESIDNFQKLSIDITAPARANTYPLKDVTSNSKKSRTLSGDPTGSKKRSNTYSKEEIDLMGKLSEATKPMSAKRGEEISFKYHPDHSPALKRKMYELPPQFQSVTLLRGIYE